MNRTTATGLFLMLSAFMLFVSFFGGHLLATSGNLLTGSMPDVTNNLVLDELYSSNASTAGTMNLFQYLQFAADHPDLHQSYAQYLLTKNIPGFDWVSNTVSFMVAMLSFTVPGIAILSILWWFLSILWLWLIVVIVRGNPVG